MQVEFKKINRWGLHKPVVHADVTDGGVVLPVIWEPKRWGGWRCYHCGDDADLAECPHIDAVEDLLAPSVLGDWDPLDDDEHLLVLQ